MSSNQTGEYSVILEWFQENPQVVMTLPEIAMQFDLPRTKAGNALNWWVRKNELIRVSKGHYRLRRPDEKREEFKVARVTPKVQKPVEITYPVIEEISPDKISPEAKRIINSLYATRAMEGRIQYLNSSTFIVWNSREQLENVRQMAFGH